GQQVRQPGAAHHGLVDDLGARGRAGIDAQVVLKDHRRTGRDRADVDTRSQRGGAAVRLADRRSVEERGIRDVSRIRWNRVLQDHARRRNRGGILYRDRVAQYVARIDDSRRTQIREQNGVLLGVEYRTIADDVARRIIGDRRARVIGRLID